MQELTKVQKEFLKILESFTHDKEYFLPEDFNEFAQLLKIAQEHHMAAAVYEKIRISSVCRIPENAGYMMMWKQMAIRDVMMQVQRENGFLAVYEKLGAAGIRPLVVKGCVCRNLYSNPDYRISGDEDMLLPRGDFEKCDEILLAEGLMREELNMDCLPYEIPYRNPKNGVYIELHFSLFPEESGAYGHLNEEFQDVFEKCIYEEIQGKKVFTLSPTSHMFYLICHSFKHFLHGGFGLRQVCDMVKMAEYYGSQIDWKDIEKRLVRLNMSDYWNALVEIGTKYLGFSLEKAAYPENMKKAEVDYVPMLEDLLDSGIYGNSTMERKHSSNMTLAAAASGKKDTTGSIMASLFPNAEYMKGQFAWVEKYPWLLPATYVIRIVRYLKNSGKKEKDEQSSVQIGMERVELLRKYNIIK